MSGPFLINFLGAASVMAGGGLDDDETASRYGGWGVGLRRV